MTKARNIADLGSNDVLDTSSSGIDVTGTVTADEVSGQALRLDRVTSGNNIDIDVYNPISTTGVITKIRTDGDGISNIYGALSFHTTQTPDTLTQRMRIASNGDISFYEDTGTTAKFFWKAADERLGIGTSSPSSPLHVYSTSTAINRFEVNSTSDSGIRIMNTAGDYSIYTAGGSLRLADNNATERMRIDSNGNVGIGTSSPSAKLDIVGANNTTNMELHNTSGANYIEVKNGTSTGYFGVTGANDVAVLAIDANSPVKIGTDGGQTRMTVVSDGKVGIGKTNPVAKLDVLARGGTSFGTTSTVSDMSNGGYIRVQDDQNNVDNILAGIQFTAFNGDSVVAGTYDTTNGSSLLFGTESGGILSEKMRIDSSGRVTMPYQPSFCATGDASTTVGNNYAALIYTTIKHNNGNHYNATNGRFTAPVSGYYLFTGHICPTGTVQYATGELFLMINGSTGNRYFLDRRKKSEGTSQNSYSMSGSAVVYLSSGDYINLSHVGLTSTATIEGSSVFSGQLLG